jgi:hypothetical protein
LCAIEVAIVPASAYRFPAQKAQPMLARTLICCLLALGTFHVHAAVNVLRHYQLGEADPGAVLGGIATNSLDSAGTNHLSMVGSPTYSSDTPLNSSRSLVFTGTNYGTADTIPNLTDNFGLEAWVKTTSTSNSHFVAYNGYTGGSGWGFLQAGTNYLGLFGGVEVFGSAPVTVGQWTHLAIVRDNGTATLYVNGIAVGSTAAAPNPASGSFAVGSTPSPDDFFQGWIDDVRVFTFAPGAFQTNDLLYASMPSLALTRPDANNVNLTWPANSPEFGLEYTGNLASNSWARVKADVTNNLCLVKDGIGGNRFYRLVKPWGTNSPPALPGYENEETGTDPLVPKKYFFVNGVPVVIEPLILVSWDPLTIHIGIQGSSPCTIDASAIVDPLSPTNGSLSFHWSINSVSFDGPIVIPRIKGYDSPLLCMQQDALPNGDFSFQLVVTRHSDQATGLFQLEVAVRGSLLSVRTATECWPNGSTNGDNCDIIAALPGFQCP